MSEPLLSVIVPWRNRPELAASLAHTLLLLAPLEAEVVVASCGPMVLATPTCWCCWSAAARARTDPGSGRRA